MATVNPNYGTKLIQSAPTNAVPTTTATPQVQPVVPAATPATAATTGATTTTPTPLQSAQNRQMQGLTQYDTLINNQSSTVDFIKNTEQELGIPQAQKEAATLREQAQSLSDQIKRIKPTIAATTRDSFVTEGQRSMMESARQQPLMEQLNTTQSNISQKEQSINALNDRVARLTTGFTADKQSNLTLTLQKISRGEAISDQEREEAVAAINAENAYKKQLELMDKQFAQDKEMARYQTDLAIEQARKTRVGSGSSESSNAYDFLKSLMNGGGTTTTNGTNNSGAPDGGGTTTTNGTNNSGAPAGTSEYPTDSGIFRTQAEIDALKKQQAFATGAAKSVTTSPLTQKKPAQQSTADIIKSITTSPLKGKLKV